jgi:hypothetical protein
MTSPFVLITTHRVARENLPAFKALSEEYLAFVEENEPQMVAHVGSTTRDGTTVSLVQVHPDPDSADHHIEIAVPRLHGNGDLFENVSIDVYGTPGPRLQAAIDNNAAAGVTVRIFDTDLGGFARA